jgi:hypothetical protein
MYLQVHSLVSNDPYQIDDRRSHFYDQRRWFFGLNTLLSACAVYSFTYVFAPVSPQVIPMVAYTLIGVLSIAGFMSDNARLHSVIVITVAVFTFSYWWVISFRPPAFN